MEVAFLGNVLLAREFENSRIRSDRLLDVAPRRQLCHRVYSELGRIVRNVVRNFERLVPKFRWFRNG
jgi:hypothetical protein